MKKAQPVFSAPFRILVIGASLCALMLGGCLFGHDDEAPDPTVSIDSPANGSTVTGPNLFIKLKTANFKFLGAGTAAGKVSASQANAVSAHDEDDVSGHIHVYLDRPSGLDADAIKQLNKSDTVTLTGVAPGVHYLIVQGANANHADLKSMRDSVKFTVTAP